MHLKYVCICYGQRTIGQYKQVYVGEVGNTVKYLMLTELEVTLEISQGLYFLVISYKFHIIFNISVEYNNYIIGTKEGRLLQLDQSICKETLINIADVPENIEVSLRECARSANLGGQGDMNFALNKQMQV